MYSSKNKSYVIVITGANGFVGSRLVEHFSKKGFLVRALVRDPSKYKSTKSVEYLFYDVSKEFDDELIFKDASYLIHTAYVKQSNNKGDIFDINVDGAKRLVSAASKYNLEDAVFISSMSAHDQATSIYGKQKLAIEDLFIDIRGAVLKCGLILGDGGIVKDMSAFMSKWHIVPLIDNGDQPLQIVSIDDLVNVIDVLVERKKTGRYVIATPEIYSYKQFYSALAKSRSIKVVFVPLPYNFLMFIFNLAAALHLPLNLGADNLRGLKQLTSMNSAKDLEKLSVKLQKLDEALNKYR